MSPSSKGGFEKIALSSEKSVFFSYVFSIVGSKNHWTLKVEGSPSFAPVDVAELEGWV